MKEPWTVYLPCCCCCNKRSAHQPPKPDPERGQSSSSTTSNSLAEISPAERAIDIALRHSSELPEEDAAREANPPPSYDSVLKDDDRRNPNPRRGPAELHGSAAPRFPPPVATGKEGYQHYQPPQPQQQQQPAPPHQPQGSVFSDENEDDLILTPPTTAPPTVMDEDSEDERFDGVFRRR
ncbi:hypothetical protein M409DRAFT_55553 [Zasmidium cellare ATCC 36951]|uniref:Uncharacterized protein n=1 Tax=Zasmidium cellare ATCC 36951 TaxID=1080233 RepID=A0A6A6CEW3_ZASCE|nr:uncharacterized protein M409DRAFT_55553 [Zasmidium cellare ATCC 36951]KAF2165665.1 hypothetical protein M409DRAFT_55553 [Zasmidium cellare ATCC 36951]